ENSSFPSCAKSSHSEGTLRTWLGEITKAYITQTELPPVESIHYSLADASPPFLHYLEQSLEHLSPLHRLIVVMAQTFQWRPIRIAAYLRAEGTVLSEAEVEQSLAQGYQALTAALPEDICEIYHLQSVQ
ncbi:MAG: hypothetical protein VKL39_09050, partial [Leptolyngbyaceae bacterium]|nr:hypothetical protein [Leptolyngbyaceae bacterium]